MPIRTDFLAVIGAALFQGFYFRPGDNAKAAKREYGSSNRDARRRLLCALVANRAPIDGRFLSNWKWKGFFNSCGSDTLW